MCDLDTFMNKIHLKSIKFETKLLLINQHILEKLGKVIHTAVNVRGGGGGTHIICVGYVPHVFSKVGSIEPISLKN